LSKTTPRTSSGEVIVGSYAQLADALLGGTTGLCLLDGSLKPLGHTGTVKPAQVAPWLHTLGWDSSAQRSAHAQTRQAGEWLTAIALEDSAGELIAVLCVQQRPEDDGEPSARYARSVMQRLKPCIECLQRELASAPREDRDHRTGSRHQPRPRPRHDSAADGARLPLRAR
jgi:hypothetical protein